MPRSLYYESDRAVPLGQSCEWIIPFPREHEIAILFDPPSKALFTIERAEVASAGEMLAHTAGRVSTHACFLRVRQTGSAEPVRCRFNAVITPECAALERRLGVLVEQAYRRGGDPVTEAELGAIIDRATAKA
jgi:hypothetical protein